MSGRRAPRWPRFRTIQARPKDLWALPGQAYRAVVCWTGPSNAGDYKPRLARGRETRPMLYVGRYVGRRDFIALLGGTMAAWPIAARAQPANQLVGVLHGGSGAAFAPFMVAFRRGLEEAGFTEGQNVKIEYRWAENQYDRLPAMATELVQLQPAAIYAGGSVRAAKTATSTIPIVFTTGEDPVKAGLVASLNRPGGNVTGVSLFYVELGAKRLEVLHELVSTGEVIGLLVNPRSPQGVGNNTEAEQQARDTHTAASAMGLQLIVVRASNASEIDEAFTATVQQRAAALIVASDVFLSSRKDQLISLAARHAMPLIYAWPDAVTAGGLLSYGIDLAYSYRQVGGYIGRILRGAKPAELPVLQPTKFSLAINLKTAKALGLDVPTSLLLRADEVIE
jgi:putative ABC transport system substrate-binding protein